MISLQEIQKEYIKSYTDKTRKYFIENFLSTFNADKRKSVPFKLFPRQIEFLKSIVKYPNSIAIKHRQAGITTVSSAWVTAQIVFADKDAPETVLCIGNKLDISQQLVTKIGDFLDQVPRYFWGDEFYSPDPKSEKNKKSIYNIRNKSELQLFNGCKVVARSSGENAARGISAVSILIFDEAAFIENGLSVYAQAVAATASVRDAKIIMVSTPNGKDQLYYRTYSKALEKKNNYNAVEFKWFQDLRYNRNLKWYKKDKETGEFEWIKEELIDSEGNIRYDEERWRELEKNGWIPTSPWYENMCQSFNGDEMKIAQELNVSFLGSSDNVIAPEVIEFQLNNNVVYLPDDWKLRDPFVEETWIWKDPIPGHRYICACLPTGEKVLTDKGLKNIEDVDFNDLLLDKDGKLTKIKNIQTRFVQNRKVIKIKTSNTFRRTSFTGNHPIWSSINTQLKRKENRYWDFKFNFNKAETLKPGDWLEYPNIYFNKNISKNNILSHTDNDLLKKALLDKDFWWFCGMWLAEGCICNDKVIYTTHNKNENEIINKIEYIIYKLFNINISIYNKKTALNCYFSNKAIADFLEKTFGKYSYGKYLSEWVKFLPNDFKLQLILGYLQGDGSVVNNKRDGQIIKFGSVSLELLEGFQDILFSLGIVSCLSLDAKNKKNIIEGRIVNCREKYQLSIGNHGTDELLTLLNIRHKITHRQKHKINNCFLSEDKTKIYIRIKEIVVYNYTGIVHNFETETHTFCCRNIATHNCDASRGDAADKTAIEIIDIDAKDENGNPYFDQVLEYNGKRTGDEIGEIIFNYASAYNNALVIIDCVGGTGDAAILTLMRLKYPNLYYDDPSLKTYTIQRKYSEYNLKDTDRLPGFHQSSVRYQMLSNFVTMVKNNSFRTRSIRVINEMETWIFKGEARRIDHMDGCHDDTLTCIAMALFVLQFSFFKMEDTKKKDAVILKSWVVNNNINSIKRQTMNNKSVSITPNRILPFYNKNTLSQNTNKVSGTYMWLIGTIKR